MSTDTPPCKASQIIQMLTSRVLYTIIHDSGVATVTLNNS